MILLTLTASTDRGGFALFHDTPTSKKIMYEKSWPREAQKSEIILHFLSKALKIKKTSVNKISKIAIDLGPGSFTGCRIVANIAKTLSKELQIPLFSTTSLDILLFQQSAPAIAILDAQKSLFYFKSDLQTPVRLLTKNELLLTLDSLPPKTKAVGLLPLDLTEELIKRKLLLSHKASDNHPQPSALGQMYFDSPHSFSQKDWTKIEPLYIRVPDAVEKFRIKN